MSSTTTTQSVRTLFQRLENGIIIPVIFFLKGNNYIAVAVDEILSAGTFNEGETIDTIATTPSFATPGEYLQSLNVHKSKAKTLKSKPKLKKTAVHSRVTATPEIKARVKQLAATGAKAPAIARELGLSAPTVYNILKA